MKRRWWCSDLGTPPMLTSPPISLLSRTGLPAGDNAARPYAPPPDPFGPEPEPEATPFACCAASVNWMNSRLNVVSHPSSLSRLCRPLPYAKSMCETSCRRRRGRLPCPSSASPRSSSISLSTSASRRRSAPYLDGKNRDKGGRRRDCDLRGGEPVPMVLS